MASWGGAASGAGTGAAIGSFVPGVGTVLGAGVGALFGGLFGGGGKKKEDDANPEDPYTSLLKQSAKTNASEGSSLTAMGTDAFAPALNYFKQLLSSNPAAIDEATRGERGRVIDQYDTARRAIANFGPRGGGTTSTLAGSQFAQAESLADITSDAKGKAATGAGALGATATGLGLQANQLASQDLNTIIQSVLAREGLNTQRRGQNLGLAGDIGETIGTLIGLSMGGGKDS